MIWWKKTIRLQMIFPGIAPKCFRRGLWGEAKRFCLCDSGVRCGCCGEAQGGINTGWRRRSRWWWGWPWWVTFPKVESPMLQWWGARSDRYFTLSLDNFPDHSYSYYILFDFAGSLEFLGFLLSLWTQNVFSAFSTLKWLQMQTVFIGISASACLFSVYVYMLLYISYI